MLIKCLFGVCLVLAMYSSASAEFIIDSFIASSSITTTGQALPDSVTVTRSSSAFAGSFTEVENGTDLTLTAGNAGAIVDLLYTFTGGTGAGGFTTNDLLGGTPGLRLDFIESDSPGVNVSYSTDGGATFLSAGGFGASATDFSLAVSTPSIIGATSLALRFTNFNPDTSFTINRLTATP